MAHRAQLAYIVAETTQDAKRSLREIHTCSAMIQLFESMVTGQASMKDQPAIPAEDDPFERMIDRHCGPRKVESQPNLQAVMDKEITAYRQRIAKARQKIQKIVYGRVPEERLQNIVNQMAVQARASSGDASVEDALLLHRLIGAVQDIQAALPDFLGRQFNLDEAVEARSRVCSRLAGNPSLMHKLNQRIAMSAYHEDRSLPELAAACNRSGTMPSQPAPNSPTIA